MNNNSNDVKCKLFECSFVNLSFRAHRINAFKKRKQIFFQLSYRTKRFSNNSANPIDNGIKTNIIETYRNIVLFDKSLLIDFKIVIIQLQKENA